ncbi:MAG: hypothetical protein PHV93_04740 [Candidatus Pacebacteria bacterium]|nr:hypothetical protein [Candidatus Paceibacterota bacterium]
MKSPYVKKDEKSPYVQDQAIAPTVASTPAPTAIATRPERVQTGGYVQTPQGAMVKQPDISKTIVFLKDSQGNLNGVRYNGKYLTPIEYEQLQEAKKTGAKDFGQDVGLGKPNLSPNLMAAAAQEGMTPPAPNVLTPEQLALLDTTQQPAAPMDTGPLLNPLEATQAGAKVLSATIGGAGAGATAGALIGGTAGLGVGAVPGAIVGGIVGAVGGLITGSIFVISQISSNEKQQVKAAMQNYKTSVKNMNNLVNMANQGAPASEVLSKFNEQEQTIKSVQALLKQKSMTPIVGDDLAKTMDEQAIIQGFLDTELNYTKQKLMAALAAPDPNKIIYNIPDATETTE